MRRAGAEGASDEDQHDGNAQEKKSPSSYVFFKAPAEFHLFTAIVGESHQQHNLTTRLDRRPEIEDR